MTPSSRPAARRSWAIGQATGRRPFTSSAPSTGRAAKARGWRLASPPAPDAARLTETLRRRAQARRERALPRRPRSEGDNRGGARERLRARDRRGLCGRGARGLEPGGGARARVLRRGAALLAPLGRARGGAGKGVGRRSRAFASSSMSACPTMSPNRSRQPAQPGSRSPKRLTRRDFFAPYAAASTGFLHLGRPVYRAARDRRREAMVDEETHDVSAGPAGAPPNRDRRRDPGVIEGEIAGPRATATESAADRSARRGGVEPPRAAAFAACWLARSPGSWSRRWPSAPSILSSRRAAMRTPTRIGWPNSKRSLSKRPRRWRPRSSGESAALAKSRQADGRARGGRRDRSSVAELDKRVAALGSGERRERAQRGRRRAGRPAGAGARLATQVKDLRADIDAARGEIPGLAARVAKLESRRAEGERRRSFRPRRPDRQDRGGARRAEERDARRRREARAGRQRLSDRDYRRRDRGQARRRRADRNRSRGPSAPRRRSGRAGGAAGGGWWSSDRERAGRVLSSGCAEGAGRGFARRERRRARSPSRPYARPRSGPRARRKLRRRSRGDRLAASRRSAAAATSRARSPRSTSCRAPRVRRRAIGRSRPGRGRRRTPPCSRSARRRSGGWRAAIAHDIAAAGARGFGPRSS